MDTSNPLNIILAIFYYALVGGLSFFSIFSVYVLVRYAKNQALGLGVAVVYIFFFLTILSRSYSIFQSIVG